MQGSIRYEAGGLTFRLFPTQAQAVGVANQLTKAMDAQFNAMPLKGTGGFLVASKPMQEIQDAAGRLPDSAVALLKSKGSYFEFADAKKIIVTQTIPKPGQIYRKGERERVVVSVTTQGDDAKDCFVEWRRPANEMRTWSMWLPSWFRWATGAEVTTNLRET